MNLETVKLLLLLPLIVLALSLMGCATSSPPSVIDCPAPPLTPSVSMPQPQMPAAGLASAGAVLLVWTGFALAWRRFFFKRA